MNCCRGHYRRHGVPERRAALAVNRVLMLLEWLDDERVSRRTFSLCRAASFFACRERMLSPMTFDWGTQ